MPNRIDQKDAALLRKGVIKGCVMALVLVAVLGLVSGRWNWTRAWFFVGMTLGLQFSVMLALWRVSPDLLVERSRIQEGTKPWDKVLVPVMAIIGPLAIWIVAAADVRAHWPPAVPLPWSAAAVAVCALGGLLTASAMMANRFFSGTVRIQSDRGHEVIDSGPYRWVRHPGYVGAVAFTLASPIALGSRLAVIPAALTALSIVLRTALEDRTLHAELPGYREYARRVRTRLVPGLW